MMYELRYERDFDASDADVFDAFTSVEGQRAMFRSDDPDWIFHSDIDFRVGGIWRVESGGPQEELYRFTHTLQAIERPRLIRLTVSEGPAGGPRYDSEAEVTFHDHAGRTLVTYVQHFSSEELRDAHARGMPGALDRLATLIRERGQATGGGSDA